MSYPLVLSSEKVSSDLFACLRYQPFNPEYAWLNTTENLVITDPEISILNAYAGGIYQQATSVITATSTFLMYDLKCCSLTSEVFFLDQNCYEDGGTQCFGVYGFEYQPGFDGAVSNKLFEHAVMDSG